MERSGNTPVTVLYLDSSNVFSGAESSLVQLVKHLDRASFRPVLCFLYPQPHHDRYREANAEVRYLSDSSDGWVNSKYWKCLPRGSDFLKRLIFGRLLALLARKERADLVHVNLLWPKPLWFLWWPRRYAFPVVGHARSYPNGVPRSRVQKACTAMIHVSRFVQEEAKKVYRHPISYQIYNPIETERYRSKHSSSVAKRMLGLNPERRLVCSVGLLSPHKGHDAAIRAFAMIARAVPDVDIYIAGGGGQAELDRLKAIAYKCGVANRTIFSAGQLENIEGVYAAAEFVYSLTLCGEAFGRVPLEVGAASRTVIATSLGAAPELVIDGKTGYLVDPSDIKGIADLTSKLLKQPSLCEEVGTSARRHVETNFAPRQHAAAVEEVYRDLLNHRP